MNNFLILMACRNCEEWVEKSLGSIMTQSYNNWECLVIDDDSDDSTYEAIVKKATLDDRISVFRNKKRLFAAESRWYLMNQIANRDDKSIVVVLDGDDWFANDDVLLTLDYEYNQRKLLSTYGSLETRSGIESWSQPYPDFVVANNLFREYKWLGTHLFTFRKGLIAFLEKKMFLDRENKPLKTGTDVALFIPILELSGTYSAFLHNILYIYNDREGGIFNMDLRREQVWNEYYVKNRMPKLKPLEQGEVDRILSV